MPAPDFFTPLYTTVRNGLLAYAPFAAIVKLGNMPDMSAVGFQTFRQNLLPNDAPEVALVQTGFKMMPFGRNSKAASFFQSISIIDSTRSLNIISMNQIKSCAAVALFKLGPDLGLTLPVKVVDWNITGGLDDAFGQPQWKRDTERWVSVFTLTAEMEADRTYLRSL